VEIFRHPTMKRATVIKDKRNIFLLKEILKVLIFFRIDIAVLHILDFSVE
jgi:hypothetical protein